MVSIDLTTLRSDKADRQVDRALRDALGLACELQSLLRHLVKQPLDDEATLALCDAWMQAYPDLAGSEQLTAREWHLAGSVDSAVECYLTTGAGEIEASQAAIR